ncbi:MAG: FlgD immunoglobulin-like domain containing protein [bacterium]
MGYGENTASGSEFGFVIHEDGDADNNWTDETGQMPQPSNANSDDHISMTVSHNNDVYLVYKTKPQKSSANGIGLFKRSAAGNWQDFTVSQGGGWTRPAVVVDETNDEIYVFWTEESAPDHGQYRKCKIGNESTLQNAKIVEVFNENAYNNISLPAHTVTSTTGLLVCAENTSKDETWYAMLPITGSEAIAKVSIEENWEGVGVYPNPFNPATTIRYSIKEAASVKLQIFNIRGQLVRTLQDSDQLPGVHERRWNGRDSYGLPVASGLYFYRLQVGSELFRGRMHLVK